MRLKNLLTFLTVLAVLLVSCASEDENIVNPPPGSVNVGLRFFNGVPDGVARRLLLERNIQTLPVNSGAMSSVVAAPSDSSLLEVVAGTTTELLTADRQRFSRNSIYTVVAMADSATGQSFDTVLLFPSTAILGTVPLAQVRLINAVPSPDLRYDVRIGCPSGPSLPGSSVSFRNSSLYREVPPGVNVFTIVEESPTGTTILGTYECDLAARRPYSFLFFRRTSNAETSIALYDEGDSTENLERPLTTVSERTSLMRVLNVGSTPVSVVNTSTTQTLVQDLAPRRLTQYISLPTCERTTPDVFESQFSDGREAFDSTSLNVRDRYTLITCDTGSNAQIIIVPPTPLVYGAEGASKVRVVHAAARAGSVVVSVGARNDPTAPNGYSPGSTLARDLTFDNTSGVVLLPPGPLPLTVTSSSTPTTIRAIGSSSIEAGRSYLIIVADRDGGGIDLLVVEDSEENKPATPIDDAVFARVVNASVASDVVPASLGNVVTDGKLFIGNSFATVIPQGSTSISIGGATSTVDAIQGLRILAIRADGGGQPNVITVRTAPLETIRGSSQRRVVNATADVPFISINYDSISVDPAIDEIFVTRVAFGETTVPDRIDRERRGSFYVFDSDTRKELYRLPISFGPLGNSYTLVVMGRKETGYSVLVLQEY
ncbi:MAG TPA: hypothetical protein DIS79_04320 [Bacteroidetes bacterium]|nr:hypothetical protein [Bacteroidota bacterium]HRK04384.1 hypothetical protein [Chlorobiota bacterium]